MTFHSQGIMNYDVFEIPMKEEVLCCRRLIVLHENLSFPEDWNVLFMRLDIHFVCFPGTNLTSPTGDCWPGYYCISGVDKANPLMLNDSQCPTGTTHPIIGHLCPAGHYCPSGTDYPIGCPAGSYQDLTNQDYCKACPLGHYCYANTSDYAPNICPGGYYCPINTTDLYEFPCPPGTFNNLTQQHSIDSCESCTPGMYCQGHGNAYPTGNCSAGWYCTNGSDASQVSGYLHDFSSKVLL